MRSWSADRVSRNFRVEIWCGPKQPGRGRLTGCQNPRPVALVFMTLWAIRPSTSFLRDRGLGNHTRSAAGHSDCTAQHHSRCGAVGHCHTRSRGKASAFSQGERHDAIPRCSRNAQAPLFFSAVVADCESASDAASESLAMNRLRQFEWSIFMPSTRIGSRTFRLTQSPSVSGSS